MGSVYRIDSEVCLLRGKSGDRLPEDRIQDNVVLNLITVKITNHLLSTYSLSRTELGYSKRNG